MRMDVDRVDVWAASMEDRPGGLHKILDSLFWGPFREIFLRLEIP